MKAPTLKNMPPDITPKAAKLWPEFFEKYKKLIKGKDEPEEQMKIAIAVFRNYAIKRNINPFNKTSENALDLRDNIENRLRSNRSRILSKTLTIVRKLKKLSNFGRIYKEVLDEISVTNKTITINSSFKITTSDSIFKGDTKKYIRAIKECSIKKGNYSFPVGDKYKHSITISEPESGMALVTMSLVFPKQFAEYVVILPEEDFKDNKKVEKAISKEYKKLIKDVPFNIDRAKAVKVTAEADTNTDELHDFIDFSKIELSQSQKDMLVEIEERNMETPIMELETKYNLNYLRSLSSPEYQYSLVKLLVKIANTRGEAVPVSWESILKSPNRYLNPAVFSKFSELLPKVRR